MASITLELSPEVEARLGAESRAARQTPESLIIVAIEQYLEDLEDYRDAVRISEEVRSGRMKTYSLEEVRAHGDGAAHQADFRAGGALRRRDRGLRVRRFIRPQGSPGPQKTAAFLGAHQTGGHLASSSG